MPDLRTGEKPLNTELMKSSCLQRLPLILVLTLATASSGMSQSPGFQFFGAPPPADFSSNLGGPEAVDEDGAPLDLGIFSRKPFTITFSVRQGYDSNVETSSTNPIESWYTNYAVGIAYQFGSPRLQLNANLGGGLTYYYNDVERPMNWNGALSLSATYLATDRLTLSFSTNTAYLSQPDISLEGGGADRNNGDYFFTSTSLSAAYQWTEKFSTVTSYNFGTTYYVEQGLNDELGYSTQTLSQSFDWLILPRTTAVLEYRANARLYYGADLDSFGQFFLFGANQQLNPRLSWTGRLGVELRDNNNPVDGKSTYIGPYLESNLRYSFGPSSSVGWVTRYGTEASGIADVTQRQTFRTGININHGFTPRLSGNLGGYWLVNYYDQYDVIESFYENIFTISAGLNYAINRFISLSAGYQYTIDTAPESTGRDYQRSVAFVGANFTF